MTTSESGAAAMRVVTISREYGSGGGEIAAQLSQRLGWRLIDHEVVIQLAQRLGVEEEDAEAHDEHLESWVVQFLSTMQAVGPMITPPTNLLIPPDNAAYTHALREVVLGAAQAGESVIVGRGGQMILRERRDTLHIRIVAPLDVRIAYVAQRENLTPAQAQQRIHQKDMDRRKYLYTNYRHTPDEAQLYDLVLNTAVLDLASCVTLIQNALNAKAARLVVPANALGPGAHLPPYTDTPADFTPPNADATQEPSGA